MGLFISIEGIEGSGKSTLHNRLGEVLRREGHEVLLTREPGGTLLGERIRAVLLQKTAGAITPRAELFLFSADRAQHVEEVIRPALERGSIVLCDRYIDSTFAYQGFGRGMNFADLRALTEIATGGLDPDLVLLLDLDPVKGLKRARARQDDVGWNRFEEETIAFHQAVRNGFLELAREFPARFGVLDAEQPADVVLSDALRLTLERLREKR